MHCKTYCFAFQKRRFCTVKAAVLQCKTAAFAMSNRNCYFSSELSLQNRAYVFAVLKMLSATALIGKKKNKSLSYSF